MVAADNGGAVNKNKIGRFNKNVASIVFINMCIGACILQEILPMDSKAVKIRTITESDTGIFYFLTTEKPQSCSILLEALPYMEI